MTNVIRTYQSNISFEKESKGLTIGKVVGTTAFAAVTVIGLGAALLKGLEKQDAYDLQNCESNPHTFACQERYNTASNDTPAQVATDWSQTAIRHDVDCSQQDDGSFVAVSGGERLVNVTASFQESLLPLAVPSALGSCNVEVSNDNGDVIDRYRVNAYPNSLVEPGFNY